MKAQMIAKTIRKMIDPIKRSIQLAIGRAVLSTVTDSKGIQEIKVQLFAGEVREMERFQNYGFTSVPLPNAEGACVFVSGNREHGICLAIDDRRYRIKNLGNGQVAIYDASGSQILLKNNNEIEVTATSKVKINSDSIELGEDALQKILKGETFQALYNAHTHLGNLGVNTGPPVVQSDATQLSTIVSAK